MNNEPSQQSSASGEDAEVQDRRLFLRSLGKWSGAAITATVATAWLAATPQAQAGGWINRRGVGGGGWINGGGGGGWINRRVGGGSWINRR